MGVQVNTALSAASNSHFFTIFDQCLANNSKDVTMPCSTHKHIASIADINNFYANTVTQ